jgi:acetolactate synthase I/II/III large subunit
MGLARMTSTTYAKETHFRKKSRANNSRQRIMTKVRVSDYVVQRLTVQGVTHAYELSGGMLVHLLDSFARQRAIALVSMHHEQAAGFAAEAHARMTGVPGIALATSGPGATNLLTAIGSCFFDSTPAVFITGQVNRNELKGDRAVRQLGFQETDIVSMARPITKAAVIAADPNEIGTVLDHAFETALAGRRGPVLVDIPMDVQGTLVDLPEPRPTLHRPFDAAHVNGEQVTECLRALANADRPLVLVGGGVQSGGAVDLVRRAIDHLGVPVVHSLMGADVLSHDHPLRTGMIGTYGNRWSNHALSECDVLLVLGSRLDIRQTGVNTKTFAKRRIVHVDVDDAEVNNRVVGVDAVIADVGEFCAALLARTRLERDWTVWRGHIAEMRSRWPDTNELRRLEGLNPNRFMRALAQASSRATAFIIDVGLHQMWAAQSLVLRPGQRFLTSGGMGSMGFALPAAIGSAFASPGQPVVAVAGDGGFQINIQELQTIVRNRLPIKIVVLNNHSHGMVRQFQESYFESRFQSTVIGYDTPDFAKVASAYGIAGRRLEGDRAASSDDFVAEALDWLWRDPAAPALLEVDVPIAANAYPKLAFGRPLNEMEPDAQPTDLVGGDAPGRSS